jgi:hypothetical protein
MFGTQLDCGDGSVVLGTQVAPDPAHGRWSFRPQPIQGDDGRLFQRRESAPFGIAVQDVATDPSLCRRIGNESYCY